MAELRLMPENKKNVENYMVTLNDSGSLCEHRILTLCVLCAIVFDITMK